MNYLDYSRLAEFRERHSPGAGHADYVDVHRFYGERGIDPASISINYDTNEFLLSDPKIVLFAHVVAAHKRSEGRLHDGPKVAKLVSFDFDREPPCVTLQPVDYELQVGTCLALDLSHPIFDGHGGTLPVHINR